MTKPAEKEVKPVAVPEVGEVRVRRLGTCDRGVWKALVYFSEKKFGELVSEMESVCEKFPEEKAYWNMLFHACMLAKDTAAQEKAATRYAMKFGSMPTGVENFSVEVPESGGESGRTLEIRTLSQTEGNMIAPVLEEVLAGGIPLHVTFDEVVKNVDVRHISRATILRLGIGLKTMVDKKIPVYVSGGEHILPLLKSMPEEKREKGDWDLLFALLVLGKMEDEFEVVAVDYAVTLGVSPPSWVVWTPPPQDKFFGKSLSSGNIKEQSVSGGGIIFSLQGSLSAAIDKLRDRIRHHMVQASVMVVDFRMVTHACWDSTLDFMELMYLADSSKKRLLVMHASPMVQKLLFTSGFPEANVYRKGQQ